MLFDPTRMEAALAALPGVTREEASERARSNDLVLNPSRSGALVTLGDDLYFYDFSSATAARLTAVAGAEEEPTFSPDGAHVAFVRGNNLHVVDIPLPNPPPSGSGEARERALTTDGGAEILNGKLDWLYQEEIYGRGRFRGYWWSPDSTQLAFLQLDERPVPEYTVVDEIPYRPTVEVTDYPKAGDPNPGVKLGIARVAGGTPLWVNLDAYSGIDLLIVDVDWVPDARQVAYQVQDREQTWLDLNHAEAVSGHSHRLLRETTRAWVNANGSPVWLEDGSFLWFSERSGFKHLYRYRADGTLIRRVTDGQWDIRTFHGVDQERGVLYFDAGARKAQTDQAIAGYDANVAAYRQTVLSGFMEVEDNLAALRLLEQEAQVQDEAVKAARLSVELASNQYKAGIVNYLNVINAQATALGNERTAVDLLNRRLIASVQLIKALGGGWSAK